MQASEILVFFNHHVANICYDTSTTCAVLVQAHLLISITAVELLLYQRRDLFYDTLVVEQ